MQRGQLLHALMAEIWRELGSSASLSKDLQPVIEKAATRATAEIEGRFAELEKQRLIRLARDSLEVERGRAPFEVAQIEQKRTLEVGGLSFSGRIDRMDRLLEGEMRGTHAIIDYKTGSRVTANDWLGPRPDDPQLPMYAVTAEEDLSALAFAKLRAGDMKSRDFPERKGNSGREGGEKLGRPGRDLEGGAGIARLGLRSGRRARRSEEGADDVQKLRPAAAMPRARTPERPRGRGGRGMRKNAMVPAAYSRPRESGGPGFRRKTWIPAFAGMTVLGR